MSRPSTSPLVSVVVPCLNPPMEFLYEALKGVVAQDYRPLELIVVDDGSGPRCRRDIELMLRDLDMPSRFLGHPDGANLGVSATRNLGVRHSEGEYVAFLDADDLWLPGKTREQVRLLQEQAGIGLVFGLSRYWLEWQEDPAHTGRDFVPDRGLRAPVILEPPDAVSRFLRGHMVVPGPSNFMVRRSSFEACGGFEPSFTGAYEDQAFLVKLSVRSPILGMPVCWNYYRQHPGSITVAVQKEGLEEDTRAHFLAWVMDYCRREGVTDPGVREALEKEFWLLAPHWRGWPRGARPWIRRARKWTLALEERFLPGAFSRYARRRGPQLSRGR